MGPKVTFELTGTHKKTQAVSCITAPSSQLYLENSMVEEMRGGGVVVVVRMRREEK